MMWTGSGSMTFGKSTSAELFIGLLLGFFGVFIIYFVITIQYGIILSPPTDYLYYIRNYAMELFLGFQSMVSGFYLPPAITWIIYKVSKTALPRSQAI
jgi:hypothetical protein